MNSNCTALYCVRDNGPRWANVNCKLNLTINKLSYSYSYSYMPHQFLCHAFTQKNKMVYYLIEMSGLSYTVITTRWQHTLFANVTPEVVFSYTLQNILNN